MWYGWLILGGLIGSLLTYAAVTLPDWWASREFNAMPDVEVIDPAIVPVESVTVGGMTFELAKERNGHLARLVSEVDRSPDGQAAADQTAGWQGSRQVCRLVEEAGHREADRHHAAHAAD